MLTAFLFSGCTGSEKPPKETPKQTEAETPVESLKEYSNDLVLHKALQRMLSQKTGRILIVGDSIAAGAGAEEEESWYSLLSVWLAKQYGIRSDIQNAAMGASTSYAGMVRVQSLPEETDFDLAFVCFGHNDGTETFSREYEAVLRSILLRFPDCGIITILPCSESNGSEKIQEIRKLSGHYGILQADMITAFAESGLSPEELSVDGVHPSSAGYRVYSEAIETLIRESIHSFPETVSSENALKKAGSVNPGMDEYERFVYIPEKEGLRSDDGCTVEFTFPEGISGKPGIDRRLFAGDGLSIFADGKEIDFEDMYWTQDYSLHAIYRLVPYTLKIEKNLTLSFSSREAAEQFYGFVFTDLR